MNTLELLRAEKGGVTASRGSKDDKGGILEGEWEFKGREIREPANGKW